MDFPEGSNVKAPRDSEFPFGAFIFGFVIKLISTRFLSHQKEALMKRLYSIALCIVLAAFISANANAQAPRVTSKPLLKTTFSDDTQKEAIMASVEFPL